MHLHLPGKGEASSGGNTEEPGQEDPDRQLLRSARANTVRDMTGNRTGLHFYWLVITTVLF